MSKDLFGEDGPTDFEMAMKRVRYLEAEVTRLENAWGEDRARLNRCLLTLAEIRDKGPASPGDRKHDMAGALLEADAVLFENRHITPEDADFIRQVNKKRDTQT